MRDLIMFIASILFFLAFGFLCFMFIDLIWNITNNPIFYLKIVVTLIIVCGFIFIVDDLTNGD